MKSPFLAIEKTLPKDKSAKEHLIEPARVLDRRTLLVLAITAFATTACSTTSEARQIPASSSGELGLTTSPEGLHDPATLHIAEQIISTFENSTTNIQYNYVENLGDGRGITAGRSGFTSGTGDLLLVVEAYVHLGGEGTPLADYLPALYEVNGSGSVEGLDGFVDAWEEAIEEDDRLKEAQDNVYKDLYLEPALNRAHSVGIETAIGQTIILDTIIQHGEGEDIDGLPYIIDQTVEALGRAHGQEENWLKKFLDIRKEHLEHAADTETRDVWQDSVDRVNALDSLLKKNPSLTPTIQWSVYGDSFSIIK